MNTRLQHFLTAENITQAQLADEIHVARASVSHILAGRNKPGFDFIESLGRHYPGLNLEWLITGRGKMYKFESPAQPQPEAPEIVPEEAPEADSAPALDLILEQAPAPRSSASPSVISSEGVAVVEKSVCKEKRITKVLVFYDDGTYREL